MSVDYTSYVGPYIQVHNPKKPSTEEFHTCPNKKCRNHGVSIGNKFCEICGTEIKLVAFPCEKPVDFDIYQEFDDRVCHAFSEWKPKEYQDYLFVIGNRKGSPGRSFDPIQDSYIEDLTKLNTAEELLAFMKMFSKEITRLKEVFGNDAVQVKWGVLGWAS